MSKRASIAVGLAIIISSVIGLRYFSRPQEKPEPAIKAPAGSFALQEAPFRPLVLKAKIEPSSVAAPDSGEAALTPEEVIDKPGPECGLHAGGGAASGTAVVVMPPRAGGYGSGARFSVLDGSGTLFSDTLPFYPFQVQHGRTGLENVVAGFGGINVRVPNSASLPLQGEGLPFRIYRNAQLIYEKEDIWLFDVASDGSSFFYVEPLGSDFSSRLVVVNLDQGTEAHYDLGTIFAHPERRLRYVAAYKANNEEIHLEPISQRYSRGLGTHYFFNSAGDWPGRSFHAPNIGRDDFVHSVSSEEVYVFNEGADSSGHLQIRKMRLDWSDIRIATEWHAQGAASTGVTGVHTSHDGAWLLFGTSTASTADRPARDEDRVFYLLDAATGEAQFVLPKGNAALQLQQLSSVLPAQATEEDVGWFNGAFFSGDDMMVVRRAPASDDTRRFYDVYDLSTVSLYGQPEFRLEGNQHSFNQCASQGFPGSLFATSQGELAYARRLP